MKLNIRAKLLGTSAILIAFMILVGVMGIVGLGSINASNDAIVTDSVGPLSNLGPMRGSFGGSVWTGGVLSWLHPRAWIVFV